LVEVLGLFLWCLMPLKDNSCINKIREIVWLSEWLLFNANSAIYQLYHGENKLHFNEQMMNNHRHLAKKKKQYILLNSFIFILWYMFFIFLIIYFSFSLSNTFESFTLSIIGSLLVQGETSVLDW
jgi:hypothetical protein